MKLIKVRIQNYRSIRDTGEFEIEAAKTILVGPNEAGKTAILKALQQIHPPEGVEGFDVMRDYPRAKFNEIDRGNVDPDHFPVATAVFGLDEADKALLPENLHGCDYVFTRFLSGTWSHALREAAPLPSFRELQKDLLRLAKHVDTRIHKPEDGSQPKLPSENLTLTTSGWSSDTVLGVRRAEQLLRWLDEVVAFVDENNEEQEQRHDRLREKLEFPAKIEAVLDTLKERVPVFVYYSNYFRVRPLIHLAHMADRLESGMMDDKQYDYGNSCLLKLLGFSARELSDLGRAREPEKSRIERRHNPNQPQFPMEVEVKVAPEEYRNALKAYQDQLDRRRLKLNAASVELTNQIRRVWNPDTTRGEANTIKIGADAQYLKVAVEDDLGVEVELSQRSEGFQWLVSFFVVFFAEAIGAHANSILLLDEPGMSLHALKQREFRKTLSLLAQDNQTIYTTHSPFLVGPDELDLVRVVEMTDRNVGTKVHTSVTTTDPAALLPLKEALGYDLGQSLFAQSRNLVLEGLTDFWYLDAMKGLLDDAGIAKLDDRIALIPASTASKVVYFATFLHANSLQVAALLDSDAAGDQAAKQDVLVHKLGSKGILRTKDYLASAIAHAEIEDLLRETLVKVAKEELGLDVTDAAAREPTSPIIGVFERHAQGFKKYKLAKAFLRWSREHSAADLTEAERWQWKKLIRTVNGAFK
jgi:predicted ATPase